MTVDLIGIVDYVHNSRSIIHQDIKPDNVLIGEDGRIQLIDFGTADVRGGTKTMHKGTTPYIWRPRL